MGFKLFKRRDKSADPPSPASPSAQDEHQHQPTLSPPARSPTPSNASRAGKAATSSLNPFRASSHSTIDVRSAPPLSPASPASNPPRQAQRQAHQQSRDQISIDTVRRRDANGSWDDLGVPLPASSPTSPTSPTSPRNLAPPDRSKLFGRTKNNNSSVSLPSLRDEAPEMDAQPRKGRWTLGRGPKSRSSSVASWNDDHGARPRDDAGDRTGAGGFVVRSFRQVTRVQEDPISPGPYESLPLPTSPPLPPIPLASPALRQEPYRSASPTPYNPRPPLSVRAVSGGDRSASPTISAEQFRMASARSRSTTSLVSVSSLAVGEPQHERPRFEPTRARRSSAGPETFESPLAPPRPMFADSRPQRSRESSNGSTTSDRRSQDRLPTSDSLASVNSYATAHEGPQLQPEIAGWDDDLKLIAIYGAETGGPPSPVREKTALPARMHAPSLAFVPPTPTGSTASSTPTTSATRPTLSPTAAKKAPTSPVSPIRTGAKKPSAWNDSSDESSSDDEDDVPLARLPQARASMSQLSLHSMGPHVDVGKNRRRSSEVEVLSGGLLERPQPAEGRGSQRRSMSAFSLATTHSSLPPVSAGPSQPPTIGNRTYSSPATPDPDVYRPSFSATDLPLLPSAQRSSTTSTASPPQNFSSSSSGSGSSAPTTPRDSSPHQSILNGKPGDRSVKFDVSSLDNAADRKWKSRLSVQGPGGPPRPIGLAAPGRSASAIGLASSTNLQSAFAADSRQNRPSSFGQQQQPRQSSAPTLASPTKSTGDVFDRMKARHKADTRQAEQIGRDLNGPSGRVHDSDDDDDDDDVPLTNLHGRGGSQAGSAYGGYSPLAQQQNFYPPPSSLGGYSQLASAPPGVDPYLYASLPPDQKMSLHQRSQQMMQMMAQAAYQAKAESSGGWDSGSQVGGGASSMVGGQEPPANRAAHMSFGSPMLGFPGMGMGMSMGMPMGMPPGYGYGPMPPMPNSHLPPFAPSMAASRQFFQQQQPTYAGSAIGFSPYQPAPQGLQRRAPASAIGISPRR